MRRIGIWAERLWVAAMIGLWVVDRYDLRRRTRRLRRWGRRAY